jgi:hypothetical protein
MNNRFIAAIVIFALMVMALIACGGVFAPVPTRPSGAYPTFTPSPLSGDNPDAAYAAAQATLVAGESRMNDLANQATAVSLDMDQAASAAAQTTLEYNQNRLMELSIQSTEVSLGMARAAATHEFIAQQTQMVWDATAYAQSQADTATYTAYQFIVTQTAQAQQIMDAQATQIAQIRASAAAYSLTATPWAAWQAEIVRTRQAGERAALWQEFFITPLKVLLVTLVLVLLIIGGVIAYQRLMPVLELGLRNLLHADHDHLLLASGMVIDANPHSHSLTHHSLPISKPPIFTDASTPQVEIIGPLEPSIINWISEAEQNLHTEGWVQP